MTFQPYSKRWQNPGYCIYIFGRKGCSACDAAKKEWPEGKYIEVMRVEDIFTMLPAGLAIEVKATLLLHGWNDTLPVVVEGLRDELIRIWW